MQGRPVHVRKISLDTVGGLEEVHLDAEVRREGHDFTADPTEIIFRGACN